MPSRRDFLQTVGATSALALAGVARIRLQPRTFAGSHPGETRIVEGIRLSWCPPGRFVMGSPPDQADHRPDEAQVNVTLTRGFWTGKFEVDARGVAPRDGPELPARKPSAELRAG